MIKALYLILTSSLTHTFISPYSFYHTRAIGKRIFQTHSKYFEWTIPQIIF